MELSRRRPAAGDSEAHQAEVNRRFMAWIGILARHDRRDYLLKKMEEWKKFVYPRVSEPLFAIITFYFAHLLPAYFATLTPGRTKNLYDGRIRPKNIGMRDFWNRLTLAYQDILIHTELERLKKANVVTTKMLVERFFTDFVEMDSRDLRTSQDCRAVSASSVTIRTATMRCPARLKSNMRWRGSVIPYAT